MVAKITAHQHEQRHVESIKHPKYLRLITYRQHREGMPHAYQEYSPQLSEVEISDSLLPCHIITI